MFYAKSEITQKAFDVLCETTKHAPCKQDENLISSIFSGSNVSQATVVEKCCTSCDARFPCLFYAIVAKHDEGVWGGYTQKQRRLLVKEYYKKYKGDERNITTLITFCQNKLNEKFPQNAQDIEKAQRSLKTA